MDKDRVNRKGNCSGDAGSFRLIVDRYLDMVARTSYRILCNRGAADEVTRSVFKWIWKKSAFYDEVLDVRALICRMTCTFCYERLRRRRWLDFLTMRSDVYETSAPPVHSQKDEYIIKETWVIFCRASRELTAEQRVVYVLCELEGVSVHEAAVMAGRDFDEARDDLRTARHRIRRELEIYGKVR